MPRFYIFQKYYVTDSHIRIPAAFKMEVFFSVIAHLSLNIISYHPAIATGWPFLNWLIPISSKSPVFPHMLHTNRFEKEYGSTGMKKSVTALIVRTAKALWL